MHQKDVEGADSRFAWWYSVLQTLCQPRIYSLSVMKLEMCCRRLPCQKSSSKSPELARSPECFPGGLRAGTPLPRDTPQLIRCILIPQLASIPPSHSGCERLPLAH